MEISIANRQRKIGIRCSRARTLISCVLERESACFDEISVVFLGDKPMQTLNRLFTGRDRPTDTLAFELTPEVIKGRPVAGIRLGEVIVGVDRGSRSEQKISCAARERTGKTPDSWSSAFVWVRRQDKEPPREDAQARGPISRLSKGIDFGAGSHKTESLDSERSLSEWPRPEEEDLRSWSQAPSGAESRVFLR